MKKLILISLLVITQYGLSGYIKAAAEEPQQIEEAADPYASWNQAVQNIPNWQQVADLVLWWKRIEAIPADLNLSNLHSLDLLGNNIKAIPDLTSLINLRQLGLNINQIKAIPALNLPSNLVTLQLNNNKINAIPASLELDKLRSLDLSFNHIKKFNPKRLLQQFPQLNYLNLNRNPLTQENVTALRNAATAAYREIEIVSDVIRPEAEEGLYIKGSEE